MYNLDTLGKAKIHGYVNADNGSDKQSQKSTTGCLFTFNDTPMDWLSKRQKCIALFSTKSEYIALAERGKESKRLAWVYSELTLLPEYDSRYVYTRTVNVQYDWQKNPVHYAKTKHMDIIHHYIKCLVDSNQVCLKHIPDTVQYGVILTKSVIQANFIKKREIMGM